MSYGEKINFRPSERTAYCRGCDKKIEPNTEKIIAFYSFRNRGQSIIICQKCVKEMSQLINNSI